MFVSVFCANIFIITNVTVTYDVNKGGHHLQSHASNTCAVLQMLQKTLTSLLLSE